MTVLAVDSLNVRLGKSDVLNDVSFSVEAGEVVGVVGPNGAGKSTLLKALLGLVPSAGAITLCGVPAAHLSSVELGQSLAYVPQDREVAWAMSVRDVVGLGRLPHRPTMLPPTKEDAEAVERALESVDALKFQDRRISELSGGERARVLIARALAQETLLLLADEPTSGLDPAHQISLLALLRRRANAGQTVLLSIHELQLAARWCDRLLLLNEGRIAADGAPAEVLSQKRIAEVFGCDAFLSEDALGPIIVPIGLADSATHR